ncbi:GNAT family N-acetyltransferase [Pedobacter sp. BS3]|uniref:GNAT family N-acetyltransferase n=1 Tax=Pedobacter sp. BS3 TaxID=2567937 RepID=UPI0011EFE427|nr:GNAT family N-acetyltransferase [Pedobacter sp. BS3]TZF82039.1 GNAT family N-acetyltransferase [Pedobacter sp. BS3]
MPIRIATLNDVDVISSLAEAIWWPSYRDIIPDEQIALMLQNMYTVEALKEQLLEGITFLLAEENNSAVGFAGFSLIDPKRKLYKIHKLYVLPSQQGKGTGKALITYIAEHCKQQDGLALQLNVNRNNPALSFYQKQGFNIVAEVDIPYYRFFMNDYVMEMSLLK